MTDRQLLQELGKPVYKKHWIPKGISILNYGYITSMIPKRYISILKNCILSKIEQL
jgi:hypothetical protein